MGALIRDSEGQVITALSKKINAPMGALEVEAKAVEAGLEFARDTGVHDFIWGVLLSCGSIGRVEFSHVKRQGNRSVHLLAKHVLGIEDYVTWIEKNPCFLEQAFYHDVASF